MASQPSTVAPQSRPPLCKICGSDRLKTFGVIATSLEDLIAKGGKKLGLDKVGAQPGYTVVLESDGTIVEDEDYFILLPENTTFMILDSSQKWTPVDKEIEIDDDVDGVGPEDNGDQPESSNDWKFLARQLKQNFACIITMSESDLQTLIDVRSTELAEELGETPERAEAIQDSLQRAIDNREEQREAKELLKLYKNAFLNDSEPAKECDQVDCFDPISSESSSLSKRIINVLNQKSSPEFSLSNVELQKVVNENEKDLQSALKIPMKKVKGLQRDCREEFQKRMSKVTSLEKLSQCLTNKINL
ncbi:DNA fragmentation factor subunit alpha isoform X2 [Scyliorhinus canicula]|uniref:DNA fragmentation factor subunit alpha isoform X2 n=1 Tax=Scyliorhinus canicula TaxID=7830 RepID=UPI0018F579D9|nr:DNA fragmentation factor subunit alpha isoform X2 [Scyliorhinus canicula]